MRCIVFLLLFLSGAAQIAGAHGHRRRVPVKKPIIPTTQAMTGHVGLGSIGGYFGASAELEYEHFLSHKGWLSATMKAQGFVGGTMAFGPIKEGEVWSQTSGYFLAPGLRLHPSGNGERVDLGLALYFPLGLGSRKDNAYGNATTGVAKNIVREFFGAWVGELTMNFQRSRSMDFTGIFFSAGSIYSNAPAVDYAFPRSRAVHAESAPLYLQFGVRFGGRW